MTRLVLLYEEAILTVTQQKTQLSRNQPTLIRRTFDMQEGAKYALNNSSRNWLLNFV